MTKARISIVKTKARPEYREIREAVERVFEIADQDRIPTYLTANRMAEERIGRIGEVKKYVDDLKP